MVEFCLRPLCKEDVQALADMAKDASLGFTNLPVTEELLKRSVESSLASFRERYIEPSQSSYCFILEEVESKSVVGTSSLLVKAGLFLPYSVLYIERHPIVGYTQNGLSRKGLLYPYSPLRGPTELCALYLKPQWRRHGVGRLLSWGRLLFMAAFLERFDERIIAELRGFVDSEGGSPFWSSLGGKILHCTYSEILEKMIRTPLDINTILPQAPLPICLLSTAAQMTLGRTHTDTQAAFNLLCSQGMRFYQKVSAIDGGPVLEGMARSVEVVAHSKQCEVEAIAPAADDRFIQRALLSNEKIDFRAMQGPVACQGRRGLILTEKMAKILEVVVGDKVRCYLIKNIHEGASR